MFLIRSISTPYRSTLVNEFACLDIARAFYARIDAALTAWTSFITLDLSVQSLDKMKLD